VSSTTVARTRWGWGAIALLALVWGLAAAGLTPLAAQYGAQAPGTLPSSADGPIIHTSGSELDRMARRLAGEIGCPVCQGQALSDSPSEMAQEMRTLIREQLQSGMTPDEVREYFSSKYGQWILLDPRPHGFNLLLYVLPFVGVVGGIGFVFLTARKWTRTPAAAGSAGRGETGETEA
jgi:cytochrome c-type biogenesis protein CcmH/NrfF